MSSKAVVLTGKSGINEYLKQIDKELGKLKEIETSKWKTSGQLTGFPTSVRTEMSTSNLIMMHASVSAREEAYNESVDLLREAGLLSNTVPVVQIDKASPEDWYADIKLRLMQVSQKQRYDELMEIKKEAKELMDKDDRKALLAKRLEKLAGTLPPSED